MGQSWKQSYEIEKFLTERACDVMSDGVRNCLTHTEIGDNLTARVFNAPEWKKATNISQARVFAYIEGQRKCIALHMVEWHMMLDGKLQSRNEVSECVEKERRSGLCNFPKYNNPWMRIENDKSVFVWKSNPSKRY